MALQFKRGRDPETGPGMKYKILIYGNSGAGKTWMAASAPRPLVLLTEQNGEQSTRLSNPDARYVVVSTIAEVREIVALAMHGELGTPEDPVESLVIDGLTEVQRLFKDEMIANPTPGGPVLEMSIPMWGELTEKMRRLLRTLRALDMHVVCTALAESEMEGEKRHIFPAFQGKKLYDEVMQYFNAVGFVEKVVDPKGGIQNVANFDTVSRIAAKNCHPIRGVRPGPVSAWLHELRTAATSSSTTAAPAAAPAGVATTATTAPAPASATPATAPAASSAPRRRPTLRRPGADAEASAVALAEQHAEAALQDGPDGDGATES